MGRIDLPDVRRDEDDNSGRVKRWKQLAAEGKAGEACDLIIEGEKEKIPFELLESLAAAPIVAESGIDRRKSMLRSGVRHRHRVKPD